MRLPRALVATAATLAILALALVLAAHWASRSEALLRWAVGQLGARLPGTLTVSGLEGALDRPVRIDSLEYVDGPTRVRARGVELDWSPAALLATRTVQVERLAVDELEIVTASDGTRSRPPEHLRLPLPVRIDRLDLRRLRFDNGRTAVELSGIALAYAGSAASHTLQLHAIDSPWGHGAGRLNVQSEQPFALDGAVTWNGEAAPGWPAQAQLRVGGSLETVQVQGELTVRDLRIPAQVQLEPFSEAPLARIAMQVSALDLSAWFEQAPATRIEARVVLGATPLRGTLQLTNAQPGTLDAGRLPLDALASSLRLDGAVLRLDDLQASLHGAGSVRGSASVAAEGIDAQLQVRALDLRKLHTALRPTQLRGTVSLSRRGTRDEFVLDLTERALRLEARAGIEGGTLTVHDARLRAREGQLQASGKLGLDGAQAFSVSARLDRLNPADLGAFPAARINGSAQIDGRLKPQWEARTRYSLRDSLWRGYRLAGDGKLVLSPGRASDVDARLTLGRNVLAAQGAYGTGRDTLRFSLDAPALTALGEAWSGSAQARGTIGGTPARPAFEVSVDARKLRVPGGFGVDMLSAEASVDAAPDPRLRVQLSGSGLEAAGNAVDTIQLTAEGVRSAHTLALRAKRGTLDLHASARGGFGAEWDRWLGRIESLDNRGEEPFQLEQPAALSVSRASVALGAAQLTWGGGRILLQDTVYTPQQIRSGGTLTGLPMRKLLALSGIDLGWDNDILLGGRWRIDAADSVNGRIEIFRESGDLVARTDEERLALGVQQLSLHVDIDSNRVTGRAAFDSKAAGTLSATGETLLSRRGSVWGLSGTAPLRLDLEGRLNSVRGLVAAFTRDVSVDARAQLRVAARGTVADPKLRGTLTAESIEIEQVATGVFLRDGTLQAQFTPGEVRLQALRVRAGDGTFTSSGVYRVAERRLALTWRAEQLAAIQMPDLLLVASGEGSAGVVDGRIGLTGRLRVDKGRVELREAGGATLGEDVVVVGEEKKQTVAGRLLRSQIDLKIDLGKDFAVSGRGLQARLVGALHLHNEPGAPLRADGEIKVAKGTYEAYGRTLEIEEGTLLFAGPPENPALDILALRKNQQVQAGVRVTGTARRPEVRLVSIPDVPDMEKLAWLTLGRRVEPGSQSDTETLQRYAAAMATTLGTGNFQSQIAKAIGLDEIVVLPGTDPSSEGGIVQIGKRIGKRIYVVLEQRLSTAQNVLRVNYQLARDWSLRLESGETDAVDLFYSLSFD